MGDRSCLVSSTGMPANIQTRFIAFPLPVPRSEVCADRNPPLLRSDLLQTKASTISAEPCQHSSSPTLPIEHESSTSDSNNASGARPRAEARLLFLQQREHRCARE